MNLFPTFFTLCFSYPTSIKHQDHQCKSRGMGQEAGAGPLHLKHDYMAKSVLNGKKWKDGAIHVVKGGSGTKRACLGILFSHPEKRHHVAVYLQLLDSGRHSGKSSVA